MSTDGRTALRIKWRKHTAKGERLICPYAKDCAPCSCPSVYKLSGLPCIAVGHDEAKGTHRCLQCGTVWTARDYRWQRFKILKWPKGHKRGRGETGKRSRLKPG